MPGDHHDKGKVRYDLFPADALHAIAEVLTYGATKYDDDNWARGIANRRVFSSCLRHLWAWWRREDNDPESGLSHLAHAGCNIMFLLAYQLRGMVEWDERPSERRPSAQ